MVFELLNKAKLNGSPSSLPVVNEIIKFEGKTHEIHNTNVIKKGHCVVCNRNLGFSLMSRCRYCGQVVCSVHVSPRKHDCPGIGDSRAGDTMRERAGPGINSHGS